MKANKQGISLIVLVITIVVVIILAAAVILSLNGNNPIDNARIANLAQSKDSIYSAIYSYEGAVEAKTQGYFTKQQILLGTAAADATATNDPIVQAGSAKYAIVSDGTGEGKATTNAAGTAVNVYKLDAGTDTTGFKGNVGEALPGAPVAGSYWAIDTEGQVYLVFPSTATVPSWMGGEKNDTDLSKTKANIKEDSTLSKLILFE